MTRPVVLVTRPEYRRGEPVFASCPDLDCVAAPEDEAGLIETSRISIGKVQEITDVQRQFGGLDQGTGCQSLLVVAIEFVGAQIEVEFLPDLIVNDTTRVFVEPIVDEFQVGGAQRILQVE